MAMILTGSYEATSWYLNFCNCDFVFNSKFLPLRRANTKDRRVSVQSVVMEIHTDYCCDNYNGIIEHEHASLELLLLQISYS